MGKDREPGLGPGLGFAPVPKLDPGFEGDPFWFRPDSFDGPSTMASHPKVQVVSFRSVADIGCQGFCVNPDATLRTLVTLIPWYVVYQARPSFVRFRCHSAVPNYTVVFKTVPDSPLVVSAAPPRIKN